MVKTTYVIKKELTQAWDKKGHRHPVTVVDAPELTVTALIGQAEDAQVVEVGFGSRRLKNQPKPLVGKLEKLGLPTDLRHHRQIILEASETPAQIGDKLTTVTSLQVGDIVSVTGTTKGTGFTGVMKRWGFSGGPRTHGQSDRGRAPGSIGQGTTPGRVYKGKHMAGRDGGLRVTQENLIVLKIDVSNGQVWLSGTTPGPKGSVLMIKKLGHKDIDGLVGQEPQVAVDQPEQEQQEAKEQG